MIEYRTMVHADIEAGLLFCRLAGWNQLARDWEFFLKHSPDGCRVAVSGNKVVGTVTTIKYENKFSWIGMVLVDPNYQRQGIGIQLLKEGLHILGDQESVKLDATPAGRQVYLKLGFVDEYHLSRMQRTGPVNISATTAAKPLDRNDLLPLPAFDRNFFGAGRQRLLEWMWEGDQRLSFIIKQGNEIQGYCMGRHGYNYTHIGPLVAKNPSIAKELLLEALKNCTSQPVILDATHFEPQWLQWLKAIGFSEQRLFIRMYKGVNKFWAGQQNQFGILGPEFG